MAIQLMPSGSFSCSTGYFDQDIGFVFFQAVLCAAGAAEGNAAEGSAGGAA
jgi:hypothetical protein